MLFALTLHEVGGGHPSPDFENINPKSATGKWQKPSLQLPGSGLPTTVKRASLPRGKKSPTFAAMRTRVEISTPNPEVPQWPIAGHIPPTVLRELH